MANSKWQLVAAYCRLQQHVPNCRAVSSQHKAFSPRNSLVLFQPASFPARLQKEKRSPSSSQKGKPKTLKILLILKGLAKCSVRPEPEQGEMYFSALKVPSK
jgi:hypothetical protein